MEGEENPISLPGRVDTHSSNKTRLTAKRYDQGGSLAVDTRGVKFGCFSLLAISLTTKSVIQKCIWKI